MDGLGSGGKRKREGEEMSGLEDYLQLPDDYATRMSEPGKKRVTLDTASHGWILDNRSTEIIISDLVHVRIIY